MTKLEEIIQTWYDLAQGREVERSNIFFRFIAVWVAFNALYSSVANSNKDGDAQKVQCFAGIPPVIDHHRDLVSKDEEYLQAIRVLQKQGVTNLSRGGSRQIPDENDLTRVINCIYQVRNNLFHGGKLPNNPRDEKLVEASYCIVSKLIIPFINSPRLEKYKLRD